MTPKEYRHYQKISYFFEQYVNAEPQARLPDNRLNISAIQEAAELLIERGYFRDKTAMKKQALQQFSIILPEWVFNQIEERK